MRRTDMTQRFDIPIDNNVFLFLLDGGVIALADPQHAKLVGPTAENHAIVADNAGALADLGRDDLCDIDGRADVHDGYSSRLLITYCVPRFARCPLVIRRTLCGNRARW